MRLRLSLARARLDTAGPFDSTALAVAGADWPEMEKQLRLAGQEVPMHSGTHRSRQGFVPLAHAEMAATDVASAGA